VEAVGQLLDRGLIGFESVGPVVLCLFDVINDEREGDQERVGVVEVRRR